jgi:hypothetical protein
MLLKSIEGALPDNATTALNQVRSSLSSVLRDTLDSLISCLAQSAPLGASPQNVQERP